MSNVTIPYIYIQLLMQFLKHPWIRCMRAPILHTVTCTWNSTWRGSDIIQTQTDSMTPLNTIIIYRWSDRTSIFLELHCMVPVRYGKPDHCAQVLQLLLLRTCLLRHVLPLTSEHSIWSFEKFIICGLSRYAVWRRSSLYIIKLYQDTRKYIIYIGLGYHWSVSTTSSSSEKL